MDTQVHLITINKPQTTMLHPKIFVRDSLGTKYQSSGYSILVDGNEIIRMATNSLGKIEMTVYQDENVEVSPLGNENAEVVCTTCDG